jgi:hypothetical protein
MFSSGRVVFESAYPMATIAMAEPLVAFQALGRWKRHSLYSDVKNTGIVCGP